MSIRSGILALGPAVYWEMQEPAFSSLALDSSGNAHTGEYPPDVVLGIPGPEAATTCCGITYPNSGVRIIAANPLSGTGPWTLSVWWAEAHLTAAEGTLAYTGTSNSNGSGMLIAGSNLNLLRGGIEDVASGYTVLENRWHQYVYDFTPSGNRHLYVDGILSTTLAAGVPNAVPSSNNLMAFGPCPGLLAHAAFWTSALSGLNVAAMWAAGPGAVAMGSVTARVANQADFLQVNESLATDLDLLQQILAAVRKTY